MADITLKKVFAALPEADRLKSVRLSGDPFGENILYCNGRNVYIRNLKDPSQVEIFAGHSKQTTVARYSPSRLYIASADVSGKVIVWDAVNPNHPVRIEHQALEGLIKDLDWSPDSLYIVVCGHSKDRNANVFCVDDGIPCGTVEGHSKLINSCSYRQIRPFSIVTASEDNTVGFYRGPPFHFKALLKFHNHFAHVARYSWNGQTVLSGGADGRLFKYDVKEMEKSEVKEIGSPAHKADIYELSYSPDDKQVLTVSGDRTAKVFDVQSGNLVREFVMGNGNQDWHDMQLGCLWQNGQLLTVNACGHLIYQSLDALVQPEKIVKGHMKPIIAMAVFQDIIFTGSQEGILWWNAETGECDEVMGIQQPDELVDIVADGQHLVYVCSSQRVNFIPVSVVVDSTRSMCSGSYSCMAECYSDVWRQVALDSSPIAVDACGGFIVVACLQHLMVLEGRGKVSNLLVRSPPTCVSIHSGVCTVAAGHKDSRVRIYCTKGGFVHEIREVRMHDVVSAVAYSPCGAYLAVGAQKRVSALSATDYRELSKREEHSDRVCSVAWSPDSSRFATSALDGKIVLWDDVNDSYKERPFIIAHPKSHANRVEWLNATTFVSAGQNCNIKQFSVTVGPHSD